MPDHACISWWSGLLATEIHKNPIPRFLVPQIWPLVMSRNKHCGGGGREREREREKSAKKRQWQNNDCEFCILDGSQILEWAMLPSSVICKQFYQSTLDFSSSYASSGSAVGAGKEAKVKPTSFPFRLNSFRAWTRLRVLGTGPSFRLTSNERGIGAVTDRSSSKHRRDSGNLRQPEDSETPLP